jgi:hypothetical protein
VRNIWGNLVTLNKAVVYQGAKGVIYGRNITSIVWYQQCHDMEQALSEREVDVSIYKGPLTC